MTELTLRSFYHHALNIKNWQRYSIAFFLGALSVSAFAPYHIWPAMIIAYSGLVWLIDGIGKAKPALITGWFFGLGQFAFGLFWIAEAFSVRDGFSYGQGIAAVIALAALLALYPAIALAVMQRFWRKDISRVLFFAVIWSLFEWLRGHLFTGFPWNLNAATLSPYPVMVQSAAYFGVYGVSFLVTLMAALPAAFLNPNKNQIAWQPIISFLGLILIIIAHGSWRLNHMPIETRDDLTLVIVQPGISQKDKWRRDLIPHHFRTYMDLSTSALEKVETEKVAILWPETAIAYPLADQPGTRYLLSKLLDRPGQIITGAPRYQAQEDGSYKAWNSAFTVNAIGEIEAQFDKAHLVPFGEYVPFRSLLSLFGVERMVEALGDFESGPGPQSLSTNHLPIFSPLICYEAIFPGQVVQDNGTRPDWLINLSNDAWFGKSSGPHQHFALARFRAIEEGIPLVRATPTGISVVTDGLGRKLAELGTDKKGVLLSKLPLPISEMTPYSKMGDWPYMLLMGFFMLLYFVRKLW